MSARLERYGFFGIVAVLAALPLVAGGVRSWLIAPWLVVTLGAALASQRNAPLDRRVPPILWPLALAALLSTLQVLPWPAAAVRLLSPALSEARCATWTLLGHDCAWQPLAADWSITALDAARLWLTLAGALIVSARAQGGSRVSWLWAAVALSGLAQLLSAGASRDLSHRVGSFVSPNHQAAFYNLAWSSALGYAWLSRGLVRRAFLALTLVLFTAAVATLSRGGIAAAILGLCVYGALLSRSWSRRSISVVLGASVVLFVVAYAAAGPVSSAFDVVDPFEKLDIYGPTLEVIKHNALGVGRGGFAWAFALVRPPQRFWLQHDYVENEPLQALVDFGPLFGAVAIGAALWVTWRLLRLALPAHDGTFEPHRPKAVATAAAAVMLLAHNLVDFNWEMVGLFAPMWCLMAALAQPGARAFGAPAFASTTLAARTALWTALALALPLAAFGWWIEPVRLEREPSAANLARLLWGRPTDGAALVSLARADAPRALPWLNVAMRVDPMYGKTYIETAATLCEREAWAQAFATARRALLVEPNAGALLASVLQACGAPDAAWTSVAPPEYDRRAVLFTLQHAPAAVVPALIDEYVLLAPQHDDGVLSEMARRSRGTERWQRVMQLWKTRPISPERTAEQADVAWAAGERDAALADYRSLAAGPNLGIRARYVELLWEAGRFDEADEANQGLLRDCESEPNACRSYHRHRARSALRRGKKSDALFEQRLLLMKNPKDADAALGAGEIVAEQGDVRGALDLLDRAQGDARVDALRAKLRAQLDASDKLIEKVLRP